MDAALRQVQEGGEMTKYRADLTATEYITAPTATFAYRRFGPHGQAPLVLNVRLRGTIDHWDPALLEVLSAERDVIIFDNKGTGRTSGYTPETFEGLGQGAIEFIEALGLSEVDLLGWSMGGYVAQAVALARPDLVRRLVVVGSGPGGEIQGQPGASEQVSAKVFQIITKPDHDDEDHLYLFFPDTEQGRELGLASVRRLDGRLLADHVPVSPAAAKAQFAAITSFEGFYDRLGELTLPVLAVNGAHDIMIPAHATFAMGEQLPNAKVIFYSDAGHGVLFQHPDEFGKDVLDFLR